MAGDGILIAGDGILLAENEPPKAGVELLKAGTESRKAGTELLMAGNELLPIISAKLLKKCSFYIFTILYCIFTLRELNFINFLLKIKQN